MPYTLMTPGSRKPSPRKPVPSRLAAARKPERGGAPSASLEALARVGAELAATLDVAQVTDRIATAVLEIFGVKRAAVYRLDRDSGELVCVAEAAPGGAGRLPWLGQRLPPGAGVSGRAVAEHRLVTSPDQLADPGLSFPPWALERIRQERYRSGTAVPLMVRDEVLGTLFLGDAAGRLLPDDGLALLSAFADQAAVAIHAAQLHERLGQRLEGLQALARIDELLLSSLDSDEILAEIARAAALLMRAAQVRVWIPDEPSQTLVERAVAGELAEEGFPVRRLRFGQGVAGWVAEHRRPLEIPDFSADERILEPEWLRARGLTSAIILPIVHAESLLGVLSLIGRAPFRLDADARSLLQSFVAQSALALRNARLFDALRTRQAHLEALLEVSRELSRIQPVESLLGRITELCGRLLDSTSVGIRLVEGDDLVLSEGWGDARQVMVTPRLKMGQSLSGIVAASGEPLLVEDIGSDGRVEPAHREAARRLGYTRWLGVPLKLGERVLGVLSVRRGGNRPFTGEELEIATAFASQATAALENARLYREAQEAYARLAQTQAQLSQSQKMEAVGRLAGGIAHDFNNLLTVVIGRSELALARLRGDDPLRRDLGLIQTTSQRAAGLVRQLLAFSRKQVLRPEVLDFGVVVAGLQGMLRRLIGEDIDLLAVVAPGLGRVKADPGQLEQVIVNLVVNARDAMPGGGRITLETANVDLGEAVAAEREGVRPGAYVRLAVRDTGQGMDAETQAHIFEPFFTTKEVGKGTGLGLATVYGIVRQSEGAIRVESEPGIGTTFTIHLPRVPEEAVPAPAAAAPATLLRGTETILLVEDDRELRALGLEVLQASGYTVLEAREGNEALLVQERHPGPIHLLVTDVVMPRMGGRALAERLAVLRPGLRVLFMSGYSEAAIAQHGVLDPGTAFVPKPFTPEGLTRKVREVLDAS